MEIPKIKIPQIGGLDGLKEKLGLGGAEDDRRDDARVNDFGDFEEYDDFNEIDGDYGDGYGALPAGGYGDDYVEPAPISAGSSSLVKPAGIQQSSGYSAYPKLISFEDVRSHTAATEEARREAAAREDRAARQAEADRAADGGRVLPDARAGQPSPQIERAAAMQGYDAASAEAPAPAPAPLKEFSMPRMVAIMRPFKYDDVQAIAEALRKGDAVVLDLAATPPELTRRILDFSFGAASVADATVDCLAAKVFTITVGAPLSEEEIGRLVNQGVLGR